MTVQQITSDQARDRLDEIGRDDIDEDCFTEFFNDENFTDSQDDEEIVDEYDDRHSGQSPEAWVRDVLASEIEVVRGQSNALYEAIDFGRAYRQVTKSQGYGICGQCGCVITPRG